MAVFNVGYHAGNFFGCHELGFIEVRSDEEETDLQERFSRRLKQALGYSHVKFQGGTVIVGRDLPPRSGLCSVCGRDATPDDDLCPRHRKMTSEALLRVAANASRR